MQKRRITIRGLVDQVGISIGSVNSTLTEDLASVCEIGGKAANNAAKATPRGSLAVHAGPF